MFNQHRAPLSPEVPSSSRFGAADPLQSLLELVLANRGGVPENRTRSLRGYRLRAAGFTDRLSTTYNPNSKMWKICQEASPKSEVMTVDLSPFTRQLTPSKLALFPPRLGILIIGDKK
jgi:hypothetical protein